MVHDLLLNLAQVGLRADAGHLGAHVLAHRHCAQLVEERLFDHLARDVAAQLLAALRLAHHEQRVDVVAGEQAVGLFAADPRLDRYGGRRHEAGGNAARLDPLVEHGEQLVFGLREGLALDRGRGRVGVAAPAQNPQHGADVDLLGAAARDHVDLRLHERQREDDLEVLHLDHLLHQEGEVGDVGLPRDAGHDDLDPVDVQAVGGLDEVVQQGDLLRVELARDEVGDHVQVRALREQEGPCEEIPLGGGREGEGAGVLVEPQAHDGGLVRAQRDSPAADLVDQDGHRRPGRRARLQLPADVAVARRVVVVDVDLHPGAADQAGEPADPAGLAGVHEHQPLHALQLDGLDLGHVEQVDQRADEEGPQVLLLGAGEDHACIGVELLGGQERGEGVEIRVDVGGDHRHVGGGVVCGSGHGRIL